MGAASCQASTARIRAGDLRLVGKALGPGPGSPGGGAVDSVDGQTGAVDLTNSYQAKDADLTAIAGLSAANDDFL